MPLLTISHHQQKRQAECLAACAAMVLSYYDRPPDYTHLIKLLRIGYAGAPFRNLYHLASLDLSIKIEQGQIETIREAIAQGTPLIAFVSTKELSYWTETTNHAVVIVGIDDDFIYLNDPNFAEAPQQVSIPEFDLAWLEMDEYYALITPGT